MKRLPIAELMKQTEKQKVGIAQVANNTATGSTIAKIMNQTEKQKVGIAQITKVERNLEVNLEEMSKMKPINTNLLEELVEINKAILEETKAIKKKLDSIGQ